MYSYYSQALDFEFKVYEAELEGNYDIFIMLNNEGNTFNLVEWAKRNVWARAKSTGETVSVTIDTSLSPATRLLCTCNPNSDTPNIVYIYARNNSDSGWDKAWQINVTESNILEEILFILLWNRNYDPLLDTNIYRVCLTWNNFTDAIYQGTYYLFGDVLKPITACYFENDSKLYNCTRWDNVHPSPQANRNNSVLRDIGWIDETVQSPTAFFSYTDTESEETNYSGEGGGKGVVDDRSDYVPSDGLPTVSAISSGFVNLYNPTLANIQALHTFMMGDAFLDNVKKLIANPIDYIISLHLIPISPTVSGSESVKVGGIDTLVTMPKVLSQYTEFDCGKLNIDEYWGSFIDYSPYTKVSIYLPFVGIKELNPDDVMPSQINVKYRIDVLTGNFICSLQIISSRKVNAILYNYSGNMSMSIPVSATDYRQKVSAFSSLIGSGAMIAVSGGTNAMADVGFAANLANVALSKYNYSRSGNVTGDASLMGNYTPYLIISRPNQSLPSTYKGLNGYTSNIGGTVGQFSGYNEFREVKTDGLTCLEEEKQMIVDLLQNGVFV